MKRLLENREQCGGKTKILYLIGTLQIGGTERQLLGLVEHLDKQKYNPTICCFRGGPLVNEARRNGLRTEVLSAKSLKNPLFLIFSIIKLNNLLKIEKYRILHAFLFHSYVVGSFLAWINRVTIIINTRRGLENFKRIYHLFGDKMINCFTTAIIANSEAVKRDVIRKESLPPKRVRVIYNGIDIVKYNIHIDKKEKKKELAIEENGVVVGIIGNLIPYKGHKEFLYAARIVLKQFPEVKFLIIGRDDGIGRNLRNLAVKLGIEKALIFTGLRSDIPEILQIIDVQVVASHEEGFSNVILEGMAAARPLVVTNIGGNPEAVVDSKTGLIVPLKNPVEIAKAIINLLKNPQLAKQMGRAGRKRVRGNFGIERMVKETESLYEELCATHAINKNPARFNFGRNWNEFLSVIDEERIKIAADSLRNFLGIDSLQDKSFFDVGCGSGLFSLAAVKLGARKIVSIDIDSQCLDCTRRLKKKHASNYDWEVYRDSILDKQSDKYGQFDIVYSWGVLHHTGDMRKAMENIISTVSPHGHLYISIYNKTRTSGLWRLIKMYYCKHVIFQFLIMICFIPYWIANILVKDLLRLKNPFRRYLDYRNMRGMSFWHDLLDWLGGYPYEAAKPEEIVDFYRERKFQLQRLNAAKGNVCNEFLFKRID